MQPKLRNPLNPHKKPTAKPINSKRLLADFLQTPPTLKKSSLFNAFSQERDHIGRLISPRFPSSSCKKPAKLIVKVSKADYKTGTNKVLVKKNNFLFFEKGKQMVNERASDSLMGNLLTIDDSLHFSRHSSLANAVESSALSKSLGKLPKLKFVPSAKDCNAFLRLRQKNVKKVGKIIDPIQKEKEFSLVSHLGLYDANYSKIKPSAPQIIIGRSQKFAVSQEIPRIPARKEKFAKLPKTSLYKKSEFEDSRLLFARVMKEVEETVKFEERNEEVNLGIDPKLDYIYFHNNDFVRGFHNNMKKGFENVKRGFLNIKAIQEKWEKNMYI